MIHTMSLGLWGTPRKPKKKKLSQGSIAEALAMLLQIKAKNKNPHMCDDVCVCALIGESRPQFRSLHCIIRHFGASGPNRTCLRGHNFRFLFPFCFVFRARLMFCFCFGPVGGAIWRLWRRKGGSRDWMCVLCLCVFLCWFLCCSHEMDKKQGTSKTNTCAPIMKPDVIELR